MGENAQGGHRRFDCNTQQPFPGTACNSQATCFTSPRMQMLPRRKQCLPFNWKEAFVIPLATGHQQSYGLKRRWQDATVHCLQHHSTAVSKPPNKAAAAMQAIGPRGVNVRRDAAVMHAWQCYKQAVAVLLTSSLAAGVHGQLFCVMPTTNKLVHNCRQWCTRGRYPCSNATAADNMPSRHPRQHPFVKSTAHTVKRHLTK